MSSLDVFPTHIQVVFSNFNRPKHQHVYPLFGLKLVFIKNNVYYLVGVSICHVADGAIHFISQESFRIISTKIQIKT